SSWSFGGFGVWLQRRPVTLRHQWAVRLICPFPQVGEVIPRYSRPAMAALFTDEARLARWLEVEVLATEALAAIGEVPEDDAKAIRERAPEVTPAFARAVAERERVTDHDVAAFVDVVQAEVGEPAAKWVHYGLTSSDVVDTALSATLTEAADLLVRTSGELV